MSGSNRRWAFALGALSLTIAACLCTSALPFGGGGEEVVEETGSEAVVEEGAEPGTESSETSGGAGPVVTPGEGINGSNIGEVTVLGEWDLPFADKVFLSPDGTRMVTSSITIAQLFDISSGAPVELAEIEKTVVDAAFSPDSGLFALSEQDVIIYDANTGAQVDELSIFVQAVRDVEFHTDGISVLVASFAGGDAATAAMYVLGEEFGGFVKGGGGDIYSVEISPDGSLMAYDLSAENAVALVELEQSEPGQFSAQDLDPLDTGPSGIRDLDFSPDGSLLAVGFRDAKLHVYDLGSRALLHEFTEPMIGNVTPVSFSPGGDLVGATADNGLSIWDIVSGELVWSLETTPPDSFGLFLEWFPDGSAFIARESSGVPTLYGLPGASVVGGEVTTGGTAGEGESVEEGAPETGGAAGSAPADRDAYFIMLEGTDVQLEEDNLLVYSVDVSVDDAVSFYRNSYSALGLTERSLLTVQTDTTASLVFEGHESGEEIVVQMTNLASGFLTVNVRFEDVD